MTEKTKPEIEFYDGPEPTELVIRDIEIGTGAEALPGSTVDVHYLGVDFESGEEFDSSWSRNQPFQFTLGAGAVIPGWDKGVVGMQVGGRREIIIPPSLAYGAQSPGSGIAANDTLIFVVDLVKIN